MSHHEHVKLAKRGREPQRACILFPLVEGGKHCGFLIALDSPEGGKYLTDWRFEQPGVAFFPEHVT